ncbi:hypothetical protein GOTRE_066_00640, partial [Gordonia terrae NBRC 100016]
AAATDDTEAEAESPTEAIVVPAGGTTGTPETDTAVTDDAADDADADADAEEPDAATTVIPAAAAAAAAASARDEPATADDEVRTTPEPAVPASTAGWTTTDREPQVIPGSGPASQKKKRGKGLLIAAAVVVVIVAVVGGIFAYNSLRGPAPADEAATVAMDYTTALYEGDLSTLRSVTCGELNAFYSDFDDAAYERTYEAQRARNELVQTQAINAVRVVEGGNQAVVEVVAVHTNTPDQPETVTLNLQRDGDDWKVCNPT